MSNTHKIYNSPNAREFPHFFWILALLSGFRFRIIGDFYIGEIFAVMIVVDNVVARKRSVHSKTSLDKYFYCWIGFQILSNTLNATPFSRSVIVLGSAILTLAIFKSVCILTFKGYSLNKVLMCIFLGQAVAGVLQPKDYGIYNGWKFQYGYFLGAFLVFFLVEKSKFLLCQITLILLSAVSIANSARSLASFFLITFFLSIFGKRSFAKIGFGPWSWIRYFGIFMLLISIYVGYLETAKAGYLGSAEIGRAEKLTATSFGPLVGRSEVFYAIKAISERPLFGYGGEPVISENLLLVTATQLYEAGVRNTGGEDRAPENLPLHSIVLSTAVFAGIPATLIWLYCLLLSSRFIRFMPLLTASEQIPLVLISISQIWNILFSPYGALLRLSVSSAIAFLYIKYTSYESTKIDKW